MQANNLVNVYNMIKNGYSSSGTGDFGTRAIQFINSAQCHIAASVTGPIWLIFTDMINPFMPRILGIKVKF